MITGKIELNFTPKSHLLTLSRGSKSDTNPMSYLSGLVRERRAGGYFVPHRNLTKVEALLNSNGVKIEK